MATSNTGTGPQPSADEVTVYSVNGIVSSPTSAAVGGLNVQLVDKNVGPDVPLGSTTTDSGGDYQMTVRISASSLRGRHKTQPDLQVRVSTAQTLLATSEVRYNASTNETLNVTIPATATGLPSEYETLTSAIAVNYSGALSALQENAERSDITYLANKIGWDARAVALAALSSQFSGNTVQSEPGAAATPIQPALYYALFRAGLPANANTLYRADSSTVSAIWNQAIASGVIPSSLSSQISSSLATFQQLGAAHILDAVPVTGVSSMRSILMLTLGNDANLQQQFANLYTQYQNDLPTFWTAVQKAFGAQTAARLQFDGQVAFLTLNNAQLMTNLYAAEKATALTSMLDLVRRGYYQPAKWDGLLNGVPIGPIPGATPDEQRANYAALLSAQLRLSYPTAVLSEMVNAGTIPLTTDATVRSGVYQFLVQNQGKYEIGVEPLDQYLAENNLTGKVDPNVVAQIKRLQRVYQITPSDQAMNALLSQNVDSAYAIVHYGKTAFLNAFQTSMGGTEVAALTYAKAQQVYGAVLNVTTDYLTRRRTPVLGNGTTFHVGPIPGSKSGSTTNPSASATLQTLFGNLDYCACDECRSIIGPAAYLVDLLNFTNNQSPPAKSVNPQTVLLQRRPDLQYLPLTCANTNTALPYIDVVNEILEYFAANGSLTNFQGFSTDDTITSEELLAIPQNINNAAYTNLLQAFFPPPLPFHRPLELLRRLFQQFNVQLPNAMSLLRSSDAIESSGTVYGWRDILMEQIGFSRQEYRILTDSTLSLEQLYGYPSSQSDATTINLLSSLQTFSVRTGVSYDDLVSILETHFINPNTYLIPLLQELNVSFSVLQELKNGTISSSDFLTKYLPQGVAAPNPADYGGDIVAWITDPTRYAQIMSLITIANPTDATDLCSMANLQFKYSNPDPTANTLRPIDFVRLIRFIRLWQKLGLSIEQTDDLLTAFSPAIAKIVVAGTFAAGKVLSGTIAGTAWNFATPGSGSLSDIAAGIAKAIRSVTSGYSAFATGAIVYIFASSATAASPINVTATGAAGVTLTVGTDPTSDLQLLDGTFLIALPRIGFGYQVINLLDLSADTDLQSLLACWGPIGTSGTDSLYASMFLTQTQLQADPAFGPDPSGNVPKNSSDPLVNHETALRGAFNLTDAEFTTICTALGYTSATTLTLPNITEIYRRGWLARELEISVFELVRLLQYSGINPFAPPDPSPTPPAEPGMIRFIRLVQAMENASLEPFQGLYLIWNQDISGKSAPSNADIAALALTLRSDFVAVDSQFALQDDPTGAIAQSLLTLVYGSTVTNFFFGLLNGTFSVSMPYAGAVPPAAVAASSGQLSYDNVGLQLSLAGIVNSTTLAAIQAAAAGNAQFLAALTQLQGMSQAAVSPFFAQYPDLQQAYTAYAASSSLVQTRRTVLLASLLPTLQTERKQQEALAAITSAAGVDSSFATALLTNVTAIHAAVTAANAAITDLTAVEQEGFSVQFFLSNNPSAAPDQTADNVPALSYSPTATVAGTPKAGDVLTTTINSVAIPYTVAATDTTVTAVAAQIVSVINATTTADPVSSQPLNAVISASNTAGVIAIQLANPGKPITLACSVSAGGTETYTAGTQLPPGSGGGPIAAIWSGYVNVPQDGNYFLTVVADAGAAITLQIGGSTVTLTQSGDLWNTAAISLTAGNLTSFVLTATSVTANLSVYWQSKGIGLQLIPGEYMYSQMLLNQLGATYVRFLKATSLASALSIDANELLFLAQSGDLQVQGQGWLNALITSGNPTAASASQLRDVLVGLLTFARLKVALSPADERFLNVVQGLQASNDTTALLTLTGWTTDSLSALLAQFSQFFGGNTPSVLSHIANFRRIYDAYALVKACGVSASTLISATTNDPTASAVNAFESAVAARYAQTDWLNVIKPINDTMRGLQRDALVAYVLQLTSEPPLSAAVDVDTPVNTPDTLFEYLLADVETEPCMQTSRIQFALLTVQLFVERCLRSLELSSDSTKSVDPSCFSPAIWLWMKRYRLWQANREVFLWPENWLFPELRDDTTPIFTKMMGKLLQSDITDDTAAESYLDYLSDLEVVAKLEPCSMYYVPGGQNTNPITHVIARSTGASRTYYYRTYDNVSWSPWEEIQLKIDDNPVLLFLWDNRLLLFWVQVVQESSGGTPSQPSASASSIQLAGNNGATIGDLISGLDANPSLPLVSIQFNLYWSEYYNGKWQPAKSSDTSNPATFGAFPATGPGQFDRTQIQLEAEPESSPDRLLIKTGGQDSFLFYNTHSAPVIPQLTGLLPIVTGYGRDVDTYSDKLTVIDYASIFNSFSTELISSKVTDIVLGTVVPQREDSQLDWTAPFLYADTCNSFYIEIAQAEVPIYTYSGYGLDVFQPAVSIQGPPLALKPGPILSPKVSPVNTNQTIGVVNSAPIAKYVTQDPYISRALGTTGVVQYDGTAIGPSGSIVSNGTQTTPKKENV